MTARRTRISLLYEGTDISAEIAVDLINFEYTDNESGKADDIAVKLKDNQGVWIGPWFPTKGDTLEASIIDEGYGTLYCGKFKIDELAASGAPNVFEIKGVSVPLEEGIRREAKSKAWESVKLSKIVTEIATTGKLSSIFDSPADPEYDRLDQRQESDLAFLKRICDKAGLNLKITDEQIVVFDQLEYEKKDPVRSIQRGVDNIKSWNFSSQAFDLYSACEVQYYDPKTQETITHTFTDDNVIRGMTAKILERVPNFAEAERLAKAELRKRNKHEVTGDITLVGDTTLIAGLTVTVVGFGFYDGKYMIEEARHSVGGGYTVAIKLRKVMEAY